MHPLSDLFANNREWAARVTSQDPTFFNRLSQRQSPKYLWIGCADSRVPANEIVGLLPGDIFVHRNVANVVVHTDLNCLAVVQYAVDVLRVEHIIVCGHYGCGGVRAALRWEPLGLIDNWLRHVQDVADRHAGIIGAARDDADRADRLCLLNVLEQAVHVCRTTIVQDAWRRGQPLSVHGVIYSLEDGLLRDLGFGATAADQVTPLHASALGRLASGPVP